VNFHRELRDAYREIAAAEPARCVLIDGAADVDTVAASIWTALRERLLAAGAGNVASSA
jgi:dTMP kinase